MTGFNTTTATRQELERMGRRLSDMPMFRERVELYDPHLVGLLDDDELRELVQQTVHEFKASFR